MRAPRTTPKYSIKLNGSPLPQPLSAALREIHVDRALDRADMFTLVFKNERCLASDHPLLKPGTRVEIELGYEENGGRTLPVMDGEIVALKAVFPRRGAASLRVQGYTKLHRLQRGRQTRAFNGLPYSGIAERIAQECGLEASVDATSPALEMVFQRNQTNLEFLCELAGRVGYEVFATDRKLFFRRPTNEGARARTLKKGEQLLSFNPRISAALVPNEVEVRGWDRLEKREISKTAKDEGDAGSLMGGKTSGLALAERLRRGRRAVVETVVPSEAEAEATAKAILRRSALETVQATAGLQGAPDLRPGLVVEIEDVGDIFSGSYYITRAVHNYTASGFATTLMLERPAIEKAPEPLLPPLRPPERPEQRPEPPHEIQARIVDGETGRPLPNHPYEVRRGGPEGEVVERGTTDWQGNVRHRVRPGQYSVVARPREATGETGETRETGQTAQQEQPQRPGPRVPSQQPVTPPANMSECLERFAQPSALSKPARDMRLTEARDVVIWLVKQGSLQFHGGRQPRFNAQCQVVWPRPQDRLRLMPVIDGVQFVYGRLGSGRDIGMIDNVDPRCAVMLYRLANMLKTRWGASVIHHLGIGHGRGDSHDCHNTGRALDLCGVDGEHGGTCYQLDVLRDWGERPVPTPGRRPYLWPESARRTRFRLEPGSLAHDVFLSIYEFGTRECADSSERPGGNGAPTQIGDETFICHPDHPSPRLRSSHCNHVHLQVGPTRDETPPV
jgi:phage protein D